MDIDIRVGDVRAKRVWKCDTGDEYIFRLAPVLSFATRLQVDEVPNWGSRVEVDEVPDWGTRIQLAEPD